MPTTCDTLGERAKNSPSVKCKFCLETFPVFDDLQFHAQTAHQSQFHKVNRWLERTVDPKLRSLNEAANEGLIGKYAGSDDFGAMRREGSNWIDLPHAAKLIHHRGLSDPVDELEVLVRGQYGDVPSPDN